MLTDEAGESRRPAARGCSSCRIWPASARRTPIRYARGCFVGLTLAHSRGHLVRSVMEGVDLCAARQPGDHSRAGRAGEADPRLRRRRKSPLWRQIQADVFGQNVVTINAEEGPAYGVALLAAVGAGAFKNVEEACAATIRVVSRTPCDKKAAKVYDRGFPIYQQLYRSLKEDFRAIGEL